MGSIVSEDHHGQVLDIGGSKMQSNVGEKLKSILKREYRPKSKPTLPDELLYDDTGLPIWNKIIFTPQFYQTHDEIALLEKHGADILRRLEPGWTLIDIGAGDTRKVAHLLNFFERGDVPVTYLGLDISKCSLEHNIAFLTKQHPGRDAKVTCTGLWGTFEDGQRHADTINGPKLFLSLGSVLCNDEWHTAVNHLKSWKKVMRGEDLMLIGMDGHLAANQGQKLWDAYHSRPDLYGAFFSNGFKHANRLLGHPWFREDDWDIRAEVEAQPTTRHRFYFVANRDIKYPGMERAIAKGEEFDWFDSHKYCEKDVKKMCSEAGLTVVQTWKAHDSEFRQYLVKKDAADDSDDSAVAGL